MHASFQLSVSVLTMLSSHALSVRASQKRLLRLTSGFVAGAGVMTVLLLSFVALILLHIFGINTPDLVWAIACGILIGVGTAICIFYYRREKGTSLWIPRSFARHLTSRVKSTKHASESFSLGMTSVISELLFIIAPILITALVLVQLPGMWQLIGIAIYSVISLITLFSVWVLIGSGHKLSTIQRWREDNKRFLQFSAGGALAILGMFVYVCKLLTDVVGAS